MRISWFQADEAGNTLSMTNFLESTSARLGFVARLFLCRHSIPCYAKIIKKITRHIL